MNQGKSQWQGFKPEKVDSLKARIKTCFEKHDHQEKVLIELYRMVIPDWNRIVKISSFVSSQTVALRK